MSARDRALVGHLQAAWPDSTIAVEGRGAGAIVRVTWPDGLWFVVGARSLNPVRELSPGFRSWSYYEDERRPWKVGDIAPVVAAANGAAARARATFLHDAPPDDADVGGRALYRESWVGDNDHVTCIWHGFGRGPEDDPGGFYGYPVYQSCAPAGAFLHASPVARDCDGPGDP